MATDTQCSRTLSQFLFLYLPGVLLLQPNRLAQLPCTTCPTDMGLVFCCIYGVSGFQHLRNHQFFGTLAASDNRNRATQESSVAKQTGCPEKPDQPALSVQFTQFAILPH